MRSQALCRAAAARARRRAGPARTGAPTRAPRRAHGFLAWALIVLTGLHVAAALYHQLVRRDRILARILPALGRAR
ncbi:MAG: cytochrome b/b6 domain-containing protein, partial [Nitratireductor sp.]